MGPSISQTLIYASQKQQLQAKHEQIQFAPFDRVGMGSVWEESRGVVVRQYSIFPLCRRCCRHTSTAKQHNQRETRRKKATAQHFYRCPTKAPNEDTLIHEIKSANVNTQTQHLTTSTTHHQDEDPSRPPTENTRRTPSDLIQQQRTFFPNIWCSAFCLSRSRRNASCSLLSCCAKLCLSRTVRSYALSSAAIAFPGDSIGQAEGGRASGRGDRVKYARPLIWSYYWQR